MLRAALIALTCAVLLPAGRWELVFFHDVDEESLRILDLGFSSPQRGIAVGVLTRNQRPRGVALVSADGGAKWSMVDVDELPRSVYLLNDSAAWMVTDKGIWFSDEGGRAWRKISNNKNLYRVGFGTREFGLAIGARTALETHDGGRKWSRIPAIASVKASADATVFEALGFRDSSTATIAGSVRRPKPGESPLPLWMQPDAESSVQEPRLSIFLETMNGGADWKAQSTSVFGRVVDIAFSTGGRGLVLFQFDRWFKFPSEVQCMNFSTLKTVRCFANAKRAVTDTAFGEGNVAYLAGFEPPGTHAWTPVPGKVKILRSSDHTTWQEMPVDYRAVATHVAVAAHGKNAWAATDTGMILRLVD